jgi:hypothetical protein
MLTGKLPFEGPPLQVLARIVHETPPPLRHWRPELAPRLDAVVCKALAKAPAERYQTAQQFAEALAGWSLDGAAPTANGGARLAEVTPSAPGRGATLTATAPEIPAPEGPKRPVWRIIACCSVVMMVPLVLLGLVGALLLSSGGPPTKKVEQGQKAEKGQDAMKIAVVAPKADPSADVDALLAAAEKGQVTRIRELLRNAPVNGKNARGETALMRAAALGHLSAVRALLTSNVYSGGLPEVNDKDNTGETALMKAAQNGHVEIVQFLLSPPRDEYKAEVNERDNQGHTALRKLRNRRSSLPADRYKEVERLLTEAGAKE